MPLAPADTLATPPAAAPAAAAVSEQRWRTLHYYSIYRLLLAVTLLAATAFWRESLQFGSQHLPLFVVTAVLYVLFSIGCFTLAETRWRFNFQLTLQVAADIAFIVVLMHASGGISSGLALLLLATLAASGLMSRGRLALFHAALASIGILLQHTYAVLYHDAQAAQFVQPGLMSIGYFAIALLAYILSRYTAETEQLAAQRGIDLANMAQVNQLVIQDMQDGVLVVDGEGRIRQCNARAERMLGLALSGRDVLLEECAPALAQRYAAWRREGSDEDPNSGPLYNNRINARFVPVGGRRNLGAVIFLEDLTRVQSQAQQIKLAALGRLTANIAHEIRNPLGAISHAAELLGEEPAVAPTTRRLIAIIGDNTRRLDRMVTDVLKLNRGGAARRESLKVADFLASFVDQFCEVERIAREVFAVELAAPEARVLFDRSHLDQVMWNLCRNALRHCRRREGSIRVRVATERSGSIVKLDVIDDGPGVAAELRNQLFEPFFTTSPGGTGLGLYLAREMCEANGAMLEFVETEDGAQFSVLCRTGG
jgi:two-component system sensor histidine kinase PilS (NtrC family)